MRARSSTSDGSASIMRSCYTGDGGSSIMSMDLAHGGFEPVEYTQAVRSTEDELVEDEVLEEIVDPEFCGIDKTSPHKCHHNMHPTKKVAFVYATTGRRFLGCPLVGDERCRWFVWIDEPWGHVLSRSMMRLWDQAVVDGDRLSVDKPLAPYNSSVIHPLAKFLNCYG